MQQETQNSKEENDDNMFGGRSLEDDMNSEWKVLTDKKVTPLDPKYQTIKGLTGSLMKITFYKSYGRSKNNDTGEVVDSVHYLCHEFPFFVLSLPQEYENDISVKWKQIREFLYRFLIAYLNDNAPKAFQEAMEPSGNRWLDDYSTYVVLR
jgi:hypothetical protein